jgi:acetyl-CoA carboxylase biotin carboxyl carrier protein
VARKRSRAQGGGTPAARADTPLDRVRELAALLDEFRLTSLSASWSGVRVQLRREAAAAPALPVASAPVTAPAADKPTERPQPVPTSLVTVEAPMVGTFYRAPSPTADPYVREGDQVKQGQILCIIEAMKLMNEIECRHDGRIAQVLVENAQPVEYGQPLFLIEPLR